MEHYDGKKPNKLDKMRPSANLFITNPAWTGLVLNPDPRGEKPASNQNNQKDEEVMRSAFFWA